MAMFNSLMQGMMSTGGRAPPPGMSRRPMRPMMPPQMMGGQAMPPSMPMGPGDALSPPPTGPTSGGK